jgi:hypothetical protein
VREPIVVIGVRGGVERRKRRRRGWAIGVVLGCILARRWASVGWVRVPLFAIAAAFSSLSPRLVLYLATPTLTDRGRERPFRCTHMYT